MTDDDLRAHQRDLARVFNQRRFEAPNPRDFPTWDAFYEAQAQHEASLGAIEAEIASIDQHFNA